MRATWWRWLLLAAGLGLFGWFVHRAGPGEILDQLARLGWLAPLALVPYFVVYGWDTLGWRLALASFVRQRPSFARLFRVRWAGEAINNVIPSAYIGGEALKAYLLRQHGVPSEAAAASVVASKTCQILAQAVFIALGAALAVPRMPPETGARMGMIAVTLLAGTVLAALFLLQRRGMFSGLLDLLTRFSLAWPALTSRRDLLRRLDDRVLEFYRRDRQRFALSTGAYFLGWLTDAVEVYLVCHLLGVPLTPGEAVAIEAFIGVAKGLGAFVPAALGVQESGVVLLFNLFGLPAPVGAAYAIVRRGRDLVFALVGGALLACEDTPIRSLMARGRRAP